MQNYHSPIVPTQEEPSNFRAFLHFLPLAVVYSWRHLTRGTWVRWRRHYLRWKGRKWYI